MKLGNLQFGSGLALALAAFMLANVSGCTTTGSTLPAAETCSVDRQCDASGECIEIDSCKGVRRTMDARAPIDDPDMAPPARPRGPTSEARRGRPVPMDDPDVMPPPLGEVPVPGEEQY